MITRPVVTAVICVGFFLLLQALIPKAMALRNPSNVDRLMMEGQRTHKRKSYMVQRARDNEITGSIENGVGVAYDVEPYDPDRNSEELSAFVDYANMMRNDVILLDKSVETRTRKRGNIKVKKYSNQVIPNPPCCKAVEKIVELGKEVFPRFIKIKNCSRSDSCTSPYNCTEDVYYLPILKMKANFTNEDPTPKGPGVIEIHNILNVNWYAVKIPISVGCTCKSQYATNI